MIFNSYFVISASFAKRFYCSANNATAKQFTKNRTRFYKVDGFEEAIPSVTSVLSVISKPSLNYWYKKVALDKVKATLTHENVTHHHLQDEAWLTEVIKEANSEPYRFLSEAGNFGTKAHTVIEKLIKKESVFIDPTTKPVADGFKLWQQDNPNISIEQCEAVVYHPKYAYAGSIDAIGTKTCDDGSKKCIIIDWKTSNSIYNDYALQIAAYAKALEDLFNIRVEEAWIVRFDKSSPKYEAKQIENIDSVFENFLNALKLWQGLARGSPWKSKRDTTINTTATK